MEEIDIKGIELAFVAYPAMLTMLPGSNIWSILFFFMLILVGLDSIFGIYDFMSVFILDEFPTLRTSMRREKFSLILIFIMFFTSLTLFCTR